MLTLLLETGGDRALCAFARGGELLAGRDWPHEMRLSSDLPRVVRQLCEEAGISIRDVEAVACAAGPGSFTGLRIGVTAAKTAASLLDVPLALIPSLAILAATSAGAAPAAAVIPAGPGLVYAGLFHPGRIEPLPPLRQQMLPPGALPELLPEGAELYGRMGGAESAWPAQLAAPAAPTGAAILAAMARLAAGMLPGGAISPAHSAAPLYLRASAAEVRRGAG